MYSAKIDGREADMTVSVYEGETAEEQWRQEISKYSRLRHPNVLQIFGAASSSDIHAVVFHDELVPFEHFLAPYRNSHALTVYIFGCYDADQYLTFRGASSYKSASGGLFRRSTGRLCAEVIPSDGRFFDLKNPISTPESISSLWTLDDTNQEARAIASLELSQYHEIRYIWAIEGLISWSFWELEEFNLGAVVDCPDSCNEVGQSAEIASLTHPDFEFSDHWEFSDPGQSDLWDYSDAGKIIEDGWTRYDSCDVLDTPISLWISLRNGQTWFSQANHIFRQLHITSNYEDYAQHFQTSASSFRFPDRPAYWSLDPSGAQSLTPEEADRLGFPSIETETEVFTQSWDASVYAGLRKFHEAKGFDPDSQDVARYLGEPLYRPSTKIGVPFAHIDAEDSGTEDDVGSNYSVHTDEEDRDESASGEYAIDPDNHDRAPHQLDHGPSDFPVISWPIPHYNLNGIPGPSSSNASFDITSASGPDFSGFPMAYDGLGSSWGLEPSFDASIPSSTPADYFPLQNFDMAVLKDSFAVTSSFPADLHLSPELSSLIPSTSAGMNYHSWAPLDPRRPHFPPVEEIPLVENSVVDTVPRSNPVRIPTARKRDAGDMVSGRPKKKGRMDEVS
ncbi:hypothetical protein C8R44DRAFT_941195 [Mycena epipterygia]|nr:hypothetical protein C8R44DRAFT_941195 [Mycena epipterygia]